METCLFLQGDFDMVIVEAMTMRHALKIFMEAGFVDFVLETDNFAIFLRLKKASMEPTELGSIILNDIHSGCSEASFTFVKREGDVVA